MNNYIIYDFLSFSTKIHSHLSLIDYLGLSGVKFENLKGFYAYQAGTAQPRQHLYKL